MLEILISSTTFLQLRKVAGLGGFPGFRTWVRGECSPNMWYTDGESNPISGSTRMTVLPFSCVQSSMARCRRPIPRRPAPPADPWTAEAIKATHASAASIAALRITPTSMWHETFSAGAHPRKSSLSRAPRRCPWIRVANPLSPVSRSPKLQPSAPSRRRGDVERSRKPPAIRR